MAWNTLQTVGSTLERDYLHDFATGNWSLVFSIDLATGVETFTGYLSSAYNAPLITNKTTDTPATHLGWATVLYAPGNVAPNVNAQGATANFTPPVWVHMAFATRTNFVSSLYNTANPFNVTPAQIAAYGGTLAGPYELAFNTAGTKTVGLYVYSRTGYGGLDGSLTTPFLLTGFAQARGLKEWNIKLIQQAVAVTTQNSNVGPALLDGSIVTSLDIYSSPTIILNKQNNRGDSTTSSWAIYKQNSGSFSVATLSTDYSLGPAETLLSDQITLTFLVPGVYRVINQASGEVSATVPTNDSFCTTDFVISQNIVDEITLPIVTAVVTPVTAYNNTTVSSTPLVGVTNYTVSVDAAIDINGASWIQTLGTDPPIALSLSSADWITELTSRCTILCQVRLGNTVVESKIGFGPHTFTLGTGNYNIGYLLVPKSGLLYNPAGNISTPVNLILPN